LQALQEPECRRILLERYLAHRWRDHGVATVAPDEFGHLRCTSALEREHGEARQVGSLHAPTMARFTDPGQPGSGAVFDLPPASFLVPRVGLYSAPNGVVFGPRVEPGRSAS